jgi:hypothetical protein
VVAAAPWPANAGVGKSGENGLGLAWPNSKEGEEQAGLGGPPSRGTGKFSLFPFSFLICICFLNHLNRFSNPNQIKSKPHHTIKQMQQHECIIKYST